MLARERERERKREREREREIERERGRRTETETEGDKRQKERDRQTEREREIDRVEKETVNNVVSKYSKLVQKQNRSRHEWVGEVIQWELYKILKFAHTNKWYTHIAESVVEYMIRRIHWGFQIQIYV